MCGEFLSRRLPACFSSGRVLVRARVHFQRTYSPSHAAWCTRPALDKMFYVVDINLAAHDEQEASVVSPSERNQHLARAPWFWASGYRARWYRLVALFPHEEVFLSWFNKVPAMMIPDIFLLWCSPFRCSDGGRRVSGTNNERHCSRARRRSSRALTPTDTFLFKIAGLVKVRFCIHPVGADYVHASKSAACDGSSSFVRQRACGPFPVPDCSPTLCRSCEYLLSDLFVFGCWCSLVSCGRSPPQNIGRRNGAMSFPRRTLELFQPPITTRACHMLWSRHGREPRSW